MRNKIILALTASALIVGCGNNNKSNDTKTTPDPVIPENPISSIAVIDSYVIGARVCDIHNVCATTDKDGIATARFDTNGTITSKGGYIDANLNNKIDANELKAPEMKASGNSSVITPITDLINNGADEIQLAKVLDITVPELYTDPVTTDNIVLAKALQMSSVITADADSKNRLINKINSYVKDEISSSNLPNFDSTATLAGITLFANYAITATSSNDSKSFITTVQNSSATTVTTLLKNTEEVKINLVTPVTITPASDSTSTSTTTSDSATTPASNSTSTTTIDSTSSASDTTNTSTTTAVVNTTNSSLPIFGSSSTTTTTASATTSSTTNTTTTANTGSALPSIGSGTTTQTTVTVNSDSSSQTGSALPDLNSEQNSGLVDSTSTDYTVTPSATTATPRYYATFNSDESIELTKTDASNYKYKSTKTYNLLENDFNLTSYLDLNMTSVFDAETYTLADGHYNGKFLINFKDTDTKADVNITANDVDYFINGTKLGKITLKSGNVIDLNTTNDSNLSNTLTADHSFNNYNIDIASNVGTTITTKLNDLNSTFISADHNYSVSFIYDINGSSKTLSGDFKVINATAPSFTLLSGSYDDLLLEKKSLNLKIGTTNLHPLKCDISGVSGLTCVVDSNNDLNITGTPSSAIGAYRPTITLTNESHGLTYEKVINISIIDKIDTQLTSNWNLSSDGNYSDSKIFMQKIGTLSNDNISVTTTLATKPTGSPENNSTIFVLNNDGNFTNYIEFTFDQTVYSSNDVFKITTGNGKSAEFKVGDVVGSNNSIYLK